ncbi:MAG: trypsin-like peptidase domain-containing protein [Hyphomicrobiales bacterium]|nr:trypsin-like peptidase domain-containing protein [Hyphomicrobiales bacterium]
MNSIARVAAILFLLIGVDPAQAQNRTNPLPDVIAAALPSVVSITTKALANPADKKVDLATAKAQESFGSGFVIDPAGYIATNRHVVDGAFDVIVTLSDGTRLNADIIGKGRKYDIALLKVNAHRLLPAVTFADSYKLKLGDRLFVIGNPYGLGVSVSSGIVSALARNLGLTQFDRFIQTDAAINHGNSGGPLFDLDGKVVGMSTALYTGGVQKGGSIGIGFAIPSSIAQELLSVIRQYGYIRAGSFELDTRNVTADIAASLGIAQQGVIVLDVADDSPAKGRLLPGDVILALDGVPVVDVDQIYTKVAESLGHTFDVRYWRHGKTSEVEVQSVQWADEKPVATPTSPLETKDAEPMHFGVDVAPLTDALRAQFSLPKDEMGVVVTGVQPDSPGGAAGFSVGDVIEQTQVGPYVMTWNPQETEPSMPMGQMMEGSGDRASAMLKGMPARMRDMMTRRQARMSELKKQGWPNVLVLVRGAHGRRFVTMRLQDWVE